MAISQTVTCDQCGKTKGEVNHWLLCVHTSTGVEVRIIRWTDKANKRLLSQSKHLCGQECAHKALAAWMEAQAK